MKILHTADWHVGRTIRGHSRHDEQAAVLAEIVEVARSEDVDLVLAAGDQFDTASPTPAAEQLVYRTLLSLSEVAPVVMVAGNHDHPRRLQAVAPLLELGRVTVGSVPARAEDGGVVHPVDHVRVAMIPFLSQRAIVTAADLMALDGDEHGGRYARRMASIVETLCSDMSTDTVNIVVGHAMVHGGDVGGGERQAHTVFDYSVPAQTFPSTLSYVALGHLHRHQRMPATAPVWYPGSPLQLDFGEVEDTKGVLVLEVEPGLPASVEFRRIGAGRRLRVVRGTLGQVEAATSEIGDTDYVKVVLDEPARAGLADTVRHLMPQAVDVILDPRRRHDSQAIPSRAGRTHRELFVEYLSEKDAHDARVVSLFDELVDEAHEA
ncbi:MAG: metallophosphoesterase family protein [Acidimicrobiia bacterium]